MVRVKLMMFWELWLLSDTVNAHEHESKRRDMCFWDMCHVK